MRRILVFLLSIATLTITAPGCGRTGPASPTPVPAGGKAVIDGMTLSVTEVNPPGEELLSVLSLSPDTPSPDTEYILVTISATCDQETACSFDSRHGFTLTGSAGTVRGPIMTIAEGAENDRFSGQVRAWLMFPMVRGETALILAYQSPQGTGKIYLELPE